VTDAAHLAHREDLYAYALGALGDVDRETLERHLATCADCREEVHSLRPVVDSLGEAVEQVAPPPSLKRSLMEAVKPRAVQTAPRFRGAGWRRWLVPALAALTVGLLIGVGLGTVLSGDDTRTVAVKASGGELSEASGKLTLFGDGKRGAILRMAGVPTLAAGRTYQAWIERDGEILPQPTGGVTPDGRVVLALTDDLSGASAVMVTREPAGGSSQPTERPIMSASLSGS